MNLRRLHYLVVLAEELNFTRASARLHIAQPALSQQIKVLEAELGVGLIERGRTPRLTEAGHMAVREAENLLAQAENATANIQAAAQGRGGRLRLAYTRSAPGGAAGELVSEFRTQYPDVDVETQTGWTARNITELLAGRIDAGFVRPPLANPELDVLDLGTEELLIAVPSEHALSPRRRIRREQLAEHPVVFWPRVNGPGMYDRIVDQVWPDSPPHVVREEADDEQLLHAVAAGVGIAAVPAGRARTLRVHGVRLRHLSAPTPTIELGLAYRQDNTSASLRRLLDLRS